MKKMIIVLFFILISLYAAIYLLVPNKLIISNNRVMEGNPNAAYRYLIANPANWKFWMDSSAAEPQSFSLGDYLFKTNKMFTNYSEIAIKKNNNQSFISQIQFLPVAKDSFQIIWQCEITSSLNPVEKIKKYFAGRAFISITNEAIDRFQSFIQKDDKVYGAPVIKTTVNDTLLIATYFESDTIPGIKKIYSLYDELKSSITNQKSTIQDSGMLHITKLFDNTYKTMVAIPITKAIQPAFNQVIKRMVKGNILVMEKKGGPFIIKASQDILAQYVVDYGLISPAIPFQKLMTNRLAETDTSKWITKFYYPIY